MIPIGRTVSRIGRHMRILIVSTFVLAAYLVAFFAADASQNSLWGFGDVVADPSAWLRNVVASVFTYVGILSQVLTARIHKDSGELTDFLAHLNQVLKTKDFWLATLASPMVLIIAFQAVAQQSSLMFVALIAFQNGFFFRSILSGSGRPMRAR